MNTVELHFPGIDPEFYTQLSAVALVGRDLWVGTDEGQGIFRLHPSADGKGWEAAPLSDLGAVLDLPGEADEIDLEGMDWDPKSGHLWLVGSHSPKRKKAKKDDQTAPKVGRLKSVQTDKNRYLLARVPLVVTGDSSRLMLPGDGYTEAKFPAQLECAEPQPFRNALLDALGNDPHFKRFVQRNLVEDGGDILDELAIPGKDNGLDIEGLAFAGTTASGAARLFVGLRGPVLRGWATVLEVHVTASREGGTNAGRLTLETAGEDGRPHGRVFLDLDGLGIRDLCFRGDDPPDSRRANHGARLAGHALHLAWGEKIDGGRPHSCTGDRHAGARASGGDPIPRKERQPGGRHGLPAGRRRNNHPPGSL
jgi:hypothetical protein